jgi:hypothetical protein
LFGRFLEKKFGLSEILLDRFGPNIGGVDPNELTNVQGLGPLLTASSAATGITADLTEVTETNTEKLEANTRALNRVADTQQPNTGGTGPE